MIRIMRNYILTLKLDVVAHNTTITTLDLTGTEVEEGWVPLGEALRANSKHQVCMFHIPYNSK